MPNFLLRFSHCELSMMYTLRVGRVRCLSSVELVFRRLELVARSVDAMDGG
jgi:hypothetical protein